MRIVLVHNYYQQPGGEDAVFAAEAAMLAAHGHAVRQLTVDNDAIPARRSPLGAARLAAETVWSPDGFARVRSAIRAFRPDVAHFHNTFPLISPSGYDACTREGVPVVQTLHNYRLLCLNALLYRDGHVCEDCLHTPIPFPGVAHACYRESRAASGAVAATLTVHRALRTWSRAVDRYIVLTAFARALFLRGGLPAEKLVIKPNFVAPDPGFGAGHGGYALFVGRLAPEKGVAALLRAWERLDGPMPLRIIGDGPLAPAVADAARRIPGVQWLGHQPPDVVYAAMREATVLLFPSQWYEGLPRTVIEAFATGTPVVAPRHGAMQTLIRHGQTGLQYAPDDEADFAATVQWARAHPDALRAMRDAARAEFVRHYTEAANYRALIRIYTEVIAGAPAAGNA